MCICLGIVGFLVGTGLAGNLGSSSVSDFGAVSMMDVNANIARQVGNPSPPVKMTRCVILDSRFSSQQRLKFDLAKSELFKDVQIAPAIEDGLMMVRRGEADVCVVGPSVSLHAATRFLVTAKKLPSRKCALVALSNKPGSEVALRLSGADSVLDGNYSAARLTKSVVRAVVRVKPESVWSGYLAKLEQESADNDNSQSQFSSSSITVIFQNSAALLARIATGVKEGFYGRVDERELTQLTKTAIVRVVESLLAKHPGDNKELESVLIEVFEKWVLDLLDYGEGIAKLRLKKRMHHCAAISAPTSHSQPQ